MGLLLARSDSRAAQALRWGLRGLWATLQAALEEVPGDPGGAELRGLLAELGPLLDAAGSFSGPSLPVDGSGAAGAPGVSEPSDAAAPGSGLRPLARAVAADQRFHEMIQGAPLREDSDEQIWQDIQRLLLRAPAELAEEWRQRSLVMAEQSGARAEGASSIALPLGRDEVIYPGLTGAVHAAGLRSAEEAPLDPRVSALDDEELRFLAGATSACLWFIEQDPHLHHCLSSVFRFGVRPLTGEQRPRYVAELLRLWERVRAGAAGGPGKPGRHGFKDRLKERLDLDEALHSLVYLPPAGAGSWWGTLQAQARDTIFQARDRAVQAGCAAHLQLLGGSFAEVSRLAPDSLQVDYGVPGEVAVCLRLWARIDGEELKGRVLYRSPGEEA
jgi:hypothetical protein